MKRNTVNKKQREEEQQAIGAIYMQYIDTFQETSELKGKVFVKSGTLYGDDNSRSLQKGQLYNPKPVIKLKKEDPKQKTIPATPLSKNRKKSNLKALGDELKMLQHERQAKDIKLFIPNEPLSIQRADSEYTTSTNLFVSNLNPKITEDHLIEMFGSYGPLASVKIMWPRNEPTCRSANCGFVAFMSRIDAERALNELKNHQEMRINWGKAVKIPSHPIHIPRELYKLYAPPPPSGLPFNAQVGSDGATDLSNTTVKVTIPFDRNLLMTIHRVIEFVIREGPEFEALIMNMELENSDFGFLSDFQSPAHTYYRWKLFSMLNGDPKNSWSMTPFRMYENGSIWLPPTTPNYKDGMPQELISSVKRNLKLSTVQVNRLITLINNLTATRKSIAQTMCFCLEHSSAIEDVAVLIVDSLRNEATKPVKKIARLYLMTDILYNCKIRDIKVENLTESNSEAFFDMFKQLHEIYVKLSHSQDRDCLRTKICMILRAWLVHNFFDVRFITKLENIFLYGNEVGDDDDNEEPLDGANLLKRSLKTPSNDCTIVRNKSNKENFVDMFTPIGNISFEKGSKLRK